VQLWDVSQPASSTQLASAIGGDYTLSDLLFHPSVPQLISVAADGSVSIWGYSRLLPLVDDPVRAACEELAPGPTPAEWVDKLNQGQQVTIC
jgi:hypothetical protein